MIELDSVYHMKAEELLTALPDGTIDLIVTSPPYDNLRTYKGFEWDFELIARESYRVLKPGGVLVWVVGDATIDGSETLTSMRQALHFVDVTGFRMHDTMIYHKNGNIMNVHHPRYIDGFEYMFILTKGVPKTFNELTKKNVTIGAMSGAGKRQRNGQVSTFANERNPTGEFSRRDNVWRYFSGGGHADKFANTHPATFPEDLAEDHIFTWSNPGDVVLDYFSGSGTTAKMARQNGRRYIGCDIAAEYVELARKRLAQPYTVPMFAEVVPEEKPTQTAFLD
jgi:DNA modification methylase